MRPVIESGFTAEANEHGYEMLSLTAPDGEQAIRRAARYVQQGRIDGFAVFSGVPPDSRITDEIPPSVPLVHVWFYEGLLYPVVTLDPAPGLEQAVSHLVDMGHKRLAWLGLQGPEGPGAPDRLQAVRDAAGTHGIEITERFIAPRQQALGHSASVFYEKLSGKLDTLEEATAVLCYNDALAVGLCVALREAGLRVPEDVSVVGFDDVQAVHAVPRLTTVSHCFAEMGRAAVRHLDELIESGEERSEEAILVPSRLVVRESTAPAPRARGEDAT
jgi:LacI family transcriptional regulator